MKAYGALILRDLKLSARLSGGMMIGLLFFLIVISIFPIAVGPDWTLLGRIGAGVLWITLVLATLLNLDRLYLDDYEDGILEQFCLSGHELAFICFTKCITHWLTTIGPMIILLPFFALLFNLDTPTTAALVATFLAGSPALVFIGSLGAALTISLKRGKLLASILVLPFTVPVIIFALSAINGAQTDPAPFLFPFLVLIFITLIAALAGTLGSSYALRTEME